MGYLKKKNKKPPPKAHNQTPPRQGTHPQAVCNSAAGRAMQADGMAGKQTRAQPGAKEMHWDFSFINL